MNASIAAAVARERHRDMIRAAAAHRRATEAGDAGDRNRTPRRRPAWWIRATVRAA